MHFETIKELVVDESLTLSVNGDCMIGTLQDGSDIRVEKRRVYWPGDVIVYARGDGTLVTHRFLGYVYRRPHWKVITRADRGSTADVPCQLARVLGKVVKVDNTPMSVSAHDRVLASVRFCMVLVRWLTAKMKAMAGGS